MRTFIKGMTLCESFFHDCAKDILAEYFPDCLYSAGLIGYGSDVLGYDDVVSTFTKADFARYHDRIFWVGEYYYSIIYPIKDGHN